MSTVRANGLVVLDPSDIRMLSFDWDAALPAAATISTVTFTITTVKQNGATILTKDNPSITGTNRTAQVRLNATTATVGDRYTLQCKVATNESPAQTIERQCSILIQNQ